MDEEEIFFLAENSPNASAFVNSVVYDPLNDTEHLNIFKQTAGATPATLELSYKLQRILANIQQLEFVSETLGKNPHVDVQEEIIVI